MKAYGQQKKDMARDCTAIAKHGGRARIQNGKCECGRRTGKKSKKHKGAKAKERQNLAEIRDSWEK